MIHKQRVAPGKKNDKHVWYFEGGRRVESLRNEAPGGYEVFANTYHQRSDPGRATCAFGTFNCGFPRLTSVRLQFTESLQE
jgi:hypothetical protein